MTVNIGAISAVKCLRNQGGIWSGPQTLLGFNEDSCFKTPYSSETIKGQVSDQSPYLECFQGPPL